MAPGEHHVGSFAGEGELVLKEHLDVTEASIEQVGSQRGDAPHPGPALRCSRYSASTQGELLGQVVRQVCLIGGQPLGGGAEQVHGQVPRQHESTRAGGGVSEMEARRAALMGSL